MYKLLISFICSIISISSYSQNDEVIIEFDQTSARWQHSVFDSNNPDSTKYILINPRKIIRDGNEVYLQSDSRATNGDLYGFIVEKLDLFSGEVYWKYSQTAFNQDSIQEVITNHFLNDDGIILKGAQRIGIIDPNPDIDDFWVFSGDSSRISQILLDKETGNLTGKCISSENYDLYGPNLSQLKDNESIIVRQSLYDDPLDSLNQVNMAFYLFIDENDCKLNINNPSAIIPYETDVPISNLYIPVKLCHRFRSCCATIKKLRFLMFKDIIKFTFPHF